MTSNLQHSTQPSDIKLHEFLSQELEKKTDLKNTREKLQNNLKTGDNMIYKMKLEKSRGDSLFSSVNDGFKASGSALGVRTSTYLDHVMRFEQSKTLVSNAAQYQRNKIRLFTDCVLRQVWRHRFNYGFKAALVASFLYNLNKANENRDLYLLRHANPKPSDLTGFYYNSAVSFGFVLGAFALI